MTDCTKYSCLLKGVSLLSKGILSLFEPNPICVYPVVCRPIKKNLKQLNFWSNEVIWFGSFPNCWLCSYFMNQQCFGFLNWREPRGKGMLLISKLLISSHSTLVNSLSVISAVPSSSNIYCQSLDISPQLTGQKWEAGSSAAGATRPPASPMAAFHCLWNTKEPVSQKSGQPSNQFRRVRHSTGTLMNNCHTKCESQLLLCSSRKFHLTRPGIDTS